MIEVETIKDTDKKGTDTIYYRYVSDNELAEGLSSSSAVASILNINPPGVTITGTDFTTSEHDGVAPNGQADGSAINSAVFTYKLNSKPRYEVVINLAVSDSSEAELSTNRLVFTANNWNVGQQVVVKGKDDYDNDGNVPYNVSSTIQARDLDYKRISIKNLSLSTWKRVMTQPATSARPTTAAISMGLMVMTGSTGIHGQNEINGWRGNDRLYGGGDDDFLFGQISKPVVWTRR